MRRHSLHIALLAIWIFAPAGADIDWHFDQPYFVEDYDVKCKDHALIYNEGLYHLYYIQSYPYLGPGGTDLEQWLGHATSEDLRAWTRHDSILPAQPGTWEDGYIWAPCVVENPSGSGWYMLYTGVEDSPDRRQRMGAAFSEDLFEWTRLPENPVYVPDDWSDWADPVYVEATCRDPELFKVPGYSGYHLLNSVRTSLGHGALALAYSEDFVNWTQLDTLFYHTSANVLESASLYVDTTGKRHLFYKEFNYLGTYHMSSDQYFGGWNKDNADSIDSGYAPEVSVLAGKTIFSRSGVDQPALGDRHYIEFDYLEPMGRDAPNVIEQEGLRDHWHVRFGDAFDWQPTFGDNPPARGRPSAELEGNSYLGTSERYPYPGAGQPIGAYAGPGPTGLLESDHFIIEQSRISVLVAGGNLPELCFVALVRVSDGRIHFLETGQDVWGLDRRIWDTSSLVGEEVFIAIADLADIYDSMYAWFSVDSIREYPFTGDDEVTPSTPLAEDLFLPQIVEDAGFDYPATESTDFSKLRTLFR